jgi:diaminopimelate decarboxylase
MKTGEPVAILDAGMYSESASTQFNSIPRPATVLVQGSSAEVIKEREQVSDLFRLHKVPERLNKA